MSSKKSISRRQTLQLSSSILALGAGLGVALRSSEAEAASAGQFQMKLFRVTPKASALMQTLDVSPEVSTELANGAVRQLQMKWYRVTEKGSMLLGGYKLPDTLQIKIEAKG